MTHSINGEVIMDGHRNGEEVQVRRTSSWFATKVAGLFGDGRLGSAELRDKVRGALNFKAKENVAKADSTNLHAPEALQRKIATLAMKDVISSLGYEPYDVSGVTRGARRVEEGNRLIYTPKDHMDGFRNNKLRDNHFLMMVDVDYYADLPQYMNLGLPMVAYTFQPQSCGGGVGDGTAFCLDEESRVVMRVNGGESWEHNVWDFKTGVRQSKRGFFRNLRWRMDNGIKYRWWRSLCNTTYYYVESYEVPGIDPNRLLVFMIPIKRHSGLKASVLKRHGIETPTLNYRNFRYGVGMDAGVPRVVNSLSKVTRNGVIHHFAIAGKYHELVLDDAQVTTLTTRLASTNFSVLGGAESLLSKWSIPKPESLAATAVAVGTVKESLIRFVEPGRKPMFESGYATHYQCEGDSALEEAKLEVRVFSQAAITYPAVVPGKSSNNELAAIKGRVKDVKNTVIPNTRFCEYANDFINAMVPVEVRGKGVPYTIEEVNEMQSRRLQRQRARIAEAWMWAKEKASIKSFVKKETYGAPNDPRVISPTPQTNNMLLSRYTLAFKQNILKNCGWYMPAKTPEEIESQISELCQLEGDRTWIGSDFSRMDGRISEWLTKTLENAAYMRYFREDDRRELNHLLVAEHDAPGKTSFGHRYTTGYTRKSGSPLTGDPNTMVTAFVFYATLRDMKGEGWNHDLAWSETTKMCAYGDDFLGRAEAKIGLEMEKRAAWLGMKLTAEFWEDKPEFLSRIFEVSSCRVVSVPKTLRLLGKIHTTCAAPTVPLEIAAVNKAKGILASDPEAPLVREYCDMVLEHFAGVSESKLEKHADSCAVDRSYVVKEFGSSGTWSAPDSISGFDLTLESLKREGLELSPSELTELITSWMWSRLTNFRQLTAPEPNCKIDCTLSSGGTVMTKASKDKNLERTSIQPHEPKFGSTTRKDELDGCTGDTQTVKQFDVGRGIISTDGQTVIIESGDGPGSTGGEISPGLQDKNNQQTVVAEVHTLPDRRHSSSPVPKRRLSPVHTSRHASVSRIHPSTTSEKGVPTDDGSAPTGCIRSSSPKKAPATEEEKRPTAQPESRSRAREKSRVETGPPRARDSNGTFHSRGGGHCPPRTGGNRGGWQGGTWGRGGWNGNGGRKTNPPAPKLAQGAGAGIVKGRNSQQEFSRRVDATDRLMDAAERWLEGR